MTQPLPFLAAAAKKAETATTAYRIAAQAEWENCTEITIAASDAAYEARKAAESEYERASAIARIGWHVTRLLKTDCRSA